MAMFTKNLLTAALSACFATMAAASAHAAGDKATAAYYPEHYNWSFAGPFGMYDRAALQRGYRVYREVCASCHAMEFLSFRNLGQKGGPFYSSEYPNPNDNPYVRAIAAEFTIIDGPDDFGDDFERPGAPSDTFPSPFPNQNAARAANGGAYPVDLSLIAKARKYGPDYVRSLLLGYTDDVPSDFDLTPGRYYNPWFEGRQISMAPQLFEGMVTYDDGAPETPEQYAADVSHFLMWAAEPKMEVRKQLGFMVLGYLLVLAGLTYWSYRKVWSDIDH